MTDRAKSRKAEVKRRDKNLINALVLSFSLLKLINLLIWMKMDMDDNSAMEMTMVMTFGSWSDYQTKLIFNAWDITTKWEFAIAWFGIVLAGVVYHALRYVITAVEYEIKTVSLRSFVNGETSETATLLNPNNKPRKDSELPAGAKLKLRLIHAFLSAINYGVNYFCNHSFSGFDSYCFHNSLL